MDEKTADASLLAASRRGDVTAFGQLVERYHNLVTAIAYSRTGDRVLSEDIAQDTFLVAWRDLGRVRDPHKLRAWLCGIARNLAGKTLRTRGREAHEDTEQLDSRAARDSGPLSALITKESEAAVWAALQQLPPAYREPLVLFYREDQSIKQVADGLGLSEEAAKQRLSRGRVSLKANLDVVEQTVTANRPRKTAVAAVLAALALSAKTTPAAASTRPYAWKVAAAAAVLAVAATGARFVSQRSRAPAQPSVVSDDRALLAQLASARDAAGAQRGVRSCELRGSVTRGDGAPAAGVLVASIAYGWDAMSFEPVFTETDAGGRWTLAVPAGPSTLSVSIAGQRAQARVVTCTHLPAGEQRFVLDTAGTTLRGAITDVGGGPIAGATIVVAAPQRPDAFFVTRSDAAGAYELRVYPDAYAVMAMHADYTLDVRPVAIGRATAREDIALLPAASIEGVVVDASGTAVPGARIHVAPDADSPWALTSAFAGMLPYAADAAGRFVVRGLPPGRVKLSARTAALATAQPTAVEVALAEAKTDVTVTVAPARTIAGFIVARDGREGLPGIQVVAINERAPLGPPIITTTDRAGYFELAGLSAGSYRLTAAGPGYVPYVGEPSIAIEDRDVTDMLVRLDRGAALRGRVEPAQHVSVKLLPADAKDATAHIRAALARADVDDRGNFVFAAVPPGRYVIAATTYDRRGELAVTVAGADQAQLRVALEPRAMIRGQVVDDAGAPVAGVLLEVAGRAVGPLGLAPPVRTDEQGAFEIAATAGEQVRVRVFDARGQRPWAGDKRPFKPRSIEPGTPAKLVVAGAGARISGTVVDADLKPVADAWIEVRARDARDYPVLYRAAPIATDAAGRFSVDGVFGSDLVVQAARGRQRAVAPATAGAAVELTLRAAVTLVGHVAGAPALDITLRDKHTGRAQRQQTTGSFELSATPGDYELVVTSSSGYVMRELTIGPQPTTRIELALVPWASVRGKVIGTDGTPWANASIIVRETAQPIIARTDSAGAFVLDRMIAGKNQLSIMRGGIRDSATVELELAPGQQLDLETIEGRTVDLDTRDVATLWRAIEPQTTASTSVDLGLQFFVAATPPPDTTLAQVARDPLLAYRARKDADAALWIVAVTPEGPGARAGLRRGDRIVAVGSRKVGTGASAADAGMSLSTRWRTRGMPVRWTVVRDGRELTVDVTVP